MYAELWHFGRRRDSKTPRTKMVCCQGYMSQYHTSRALGPQNTCNALLSRCAAECMYRTDLKHCTHRQHQMYFSPAKGTVGLDFFFFDCNGDAGCAWGCCRKVFAADCVSASSLSLAKSRAGGAWGAACVSAGSASVERSSTTGAEGLQQYRGVTHTICCNQGTRAELWMQARNSV